jgi:hypothetical protein
MSFYNKVKLLLIRVKNLFYKNKTEKEKDIYSLW